MRLVAPEARLMFVDSNSQNSGLGASFRTTPCGPEQDLVNTFLRAIPLHVPRGYRATVFREPRLESGFPDLVIVVWREGAMREWRVERMFLNAQDLRLMHLLHSTGGGRKEEIFALFGRHAGRSIERLYEAAMIRQVGSLWMPCALRRSFAASKIIAVEAKIGNWNKVLNQAHLNTWFASRSYVLVPNLPSVQQLAEAQRLGIGVCSLDGRKVREVASESTQLPLSYASWLLNDWAWRFAKDNKDRTE